MSRYVRGLMFIVCFVVGTAYAQQQAASAVSTPAASTHAELLQLKVDDEKAADYIETLQLTREMYRWHLASSKIILWLVIALVLIGVALAAVQFVIATLRNVPASTDEVQLSLHGVKLKSQFLGVVTLALALGFFYLYLKTVYPITEGGSAKSAAVSKQAG